MSLSFSFKIDECIFVISIAFFVLSEIVDLLQNKELRICKFTVDILYVSESKVYQIFLLQRNVFLLFLDNSAEYTRQKKLYSRLKK